jgi:hypothetical protein
MPGVLQCPGELTVLDGTPTCSVEWSLVAYSAPFDPSQLDPTILAQAFGAGFSLVAGFMVFSIGIRTFLNFIKQS